MRLIRNSVLGRTLFTPRGETKQEFHQGENPLHHSQWDKQGIPSFGEPSTLLKKVDKDPKYDLAALARYAAFGVAFYPIIYYNWYRLLDRRWPGTAYSAVTKKVIIDQLILEPPLICAFYIGMNYMEGKDDIFAEVKNKFLPTFAVGCVFWMPAMAINFYFLPPSMRVAFVGMCTFVWDNFLCWLKRKPVQPSNEAQTPTNPLKSEQRMIMSAGQPLNQEDRSPEQPLKSEECAIPSEEQQLLWKEEALRCNQQCSGYLSQRTYNPQSLPDVR